MKIIKYGADWCGPCRKLSKILKESGVNYEEVDINKNPEILESKEITEIPYVEVLDDSGRIILTYKDGFTSEILEELKKKYDTGIIK